MEVMFEFELDSTSLAESSGALAKALKTAEADF